MFQKKPATSTVQPIGGAPGCEFLMAGRAKRNPAQKPIVGGSTDRSRSQRVVARVKTVKERIHIDETIKREKNCVVKEREAVRETPIKKGEEGSSSSGVM